MKIKKFLVNLSLIVGIITLIPSCDRCIGGDGDKDTLDTFIQKVPITYNIYIENSGSMAGYCDIRNKASLETLVDDYYQIITSQDNTNKVTLNFINTDIERVEDNIRSFKNSMKGKCTAPFSKIDEMLKMMMDSVDNDCINLLFSDYVFETDEGNFQMASNSISSSFAKQLKDKDFALVIFKYMVDFNGIYYPGGIPCHKPLPLYVWAFGNRENLKELTRMPFISKNCGTFFLQKPNNIDFTIEVGSKRAIGKDKKSIEVSEWDKERREDYYKFTLKANLKDVLLTAEEIQTITGYQVKSNNSSKYKIESIKKIEDDGDDKYEYTIRTDGTKTRPAPGQLVITYPITIPAWVESSNFEGNGIPTDSTTYGVAYLINGVNKAFMDVLKDRDRYNYFEININLK